MKILMLHGINHDMFGKRDPTQYGTVTLAEIDARLAALGKDLGAAVECFQTNHEGALVERIHAAHGEGVDAVVINAGAWTHYSYAIRDAVELVNVPVVEVHLSKILEREEWRRHSVLEELALHRIMGKGPEGYREALLWLMRPR